MALLPNPTQVCAFQGVPFRERRPDPPPDSDPSPQPMSPRAQAAFLLAAGMGCFTLFMLAVIVVLAHAVFWAY